MGRGHRTSVSSKTTQIRERAAFKVLFPSHATEQAYTWPGHLQVNGFCREALISNRRHQSSRDIGTKLLGLRALVQGGLLVEEALRLKMELVDTGPMFAATQDIAEGLAAELWRAEQRVTEALELSSQLNKLEWDNLCVRYFPNAIPHNTEASSSSDSMSPYFEIILSSLKTEIFEYEQWKARLNRGEQHGSPQPSRKWSSVFLLLSQLFEGPYRRFSLTRAMKTLTDAHLRQRDCFGEETFPMVYDLHKLSVCRLAQVFARDLMSLSNAVLRGVPVDQSLAIESKLLETYRSYFSRMIITDTGRLVCFWRRQPRRESSSLDKPIFLEKGDLEDYHEPVPEAKYVDGKVKERNYYGRMGKEARFIIHIGDFWGEPLGHGDYVQGSVAPYLDGIVVLPFSSGADNEDEDEFGGIERRASHGEMRDASSWTDDESFWLACERHENGRECEKWDEPESSRNNEFSVPDLRLPEAYPLLSHSPDYGSGTSVPEPSNHLASLFHRFRRGPRN